MLEDDPSAEVFVQVGEELVRRGQWADAVDVLAAGLARSDEPPSVAYALLARAALEAGTPGLALEAASALDPDPAQHPELARIEILALERSGRLDEAALKIDRFLAVDPNDVVVTSVQERLKAPPPRGNMRGFDPFYTVERAERYVLIGRTDRAVRVYRRIMLANLDDASLGLRMRQLLTARPDALDDLSSELTDPGLVPEHPDSDYAGADYRSESRDPSPGPLDMPSSRLTTPSMAPTSVRRAPSAPPPSYPPEDEHTDRLDVLEAMRAYAAGGVETSDEGDPPSEDASWSLSSDAETDPHSEAPTDEPPTTVDPALAAEARPATSRTPRSNPGADGDLDLMSGTADDWSGGDDPAKRRSLLRR